MNVAELAKLIKVSPAAIWHWENKGTIPRSGTVNVIADVLGVSRSFLQTGKQSTREIHDPAARRGRMNGDEVSLEERTAHTQDASLSSLQPGMQSNREVRRITGDQ